MPQHLFLFRRGVVLDMSNTAELTKKMSDEIPPRNELIFLRKPLLRPLTLYTIG